MTAQEKHKQERILVLYGSHSGTAQDVAEKLCTVLPEKLNTDDNVPPVDAKAVGPIALDDFLQAPSWTCIVIIVVSSFGMGDAPRNARRFRKLCDHWAADANESNNNSHNNSHNKSHNKPLDGLKFALLGLGSSLYSTYQENPSAIHAGLTAAGATLIGHKGSADAAEGEGLQQEEIDQWCQALWGHLRQAVTTRSLLPKLTQEQLNEMNENTVLP